MKTITTTFIIFLFLSSICYSQDKELMMAQGKDASVKENYSLAIYYLDKAIQLDPKYWDAYSERAHAYNQSGDYKKAIEDYNLVLKNVPDCAECFFGLGVINDVHLGDKYSAIQLFSKGIEYSILKNDSEYAGSCYFMRSNLKKDMGDTKGQMEDLKMGADLGSMMCKTFLELYQSAYGK